MATVTIPKKLIKDKETEENIRKLEMKAIILDELLEFIEEKYFGYLMKLTEKEPNISLSRAKRLMR